MFLGKESYFFVLLREELFVKMNYSQVAVRYEIAISQNLHDFCSRLSSFYWYLWLYWMHPLELRWCSANCDTESVLQAKFDYVPPQVTWIMTRDEKCDRSRDVYLNERTSERTGTLKSKWGARTTSRGGTWHHVGQPSVGLYRTRRRRRKECNKKNDTYPTFMYTWCYEEANVTIGTHYTDNGGGG